MLTATEPVTSADAPLEVILGLGVLLAFAGVVVRAFVRQWSRSGREHARREPEYRAAWPGRSAAQPPVRRPAALAGEPNAPIVAAPEPARARLAPETLAPLARVLDRSRRLAAAEDCVARELGALPRDVWLVERGVLVSGRRVPFLVAGATGVFVVCASDGAWTLRDLEIMSELADEVRERLPGYDGHPHAAVCLAFDAMKPRVWFGGEQLSGRGGWVLGADWLQRWICAFDPEHGLRNGDIRRLDEASGPFWERRSTARLPASANHG